MLISPTLNYSLNAIPVTALGSRLPSRVISALPWLTESNIHWQQMQSPSTKNIATFIYFRVYIEVKLYETSSTALIHGKYLNGWDEDSLNQFQNVAVGLIGKWPIV